MVEKFIHKSHVLGLEQAAFRDTSYYQLDNLSPNIVVVTIHKNGEKIKYSFKKMTLDDFQSHFLFTFSAISWFRVVYKNLYEIVGVPL